MPAIKAHAEFTFPYRLEGAVVAEFDCRAAADVWPGSATCFDPVQGVGDPGCGPEIENYHGVEVASGGYDHATKRMVYQWHKPDANLLAMIMEYLERGAEDNSFMEDAGVAFVQEIRDYIARYIAR